MAGQQTLEAEAEASRRHPRIDHAQAHLPVRVLYRPQEIAPPEYEDNPYITLIPPRPSTTKERGRVRAELKYAETPSREVSRNYERRDGKSCLREVVTEYTRETRVEYAYTDVDGSPLAWYDSAGKPIGEGLASRKDATTWTTPQVGYERPGMGRVTMKVTEDRRQRVETWTCEEEYEPIYERDEKGNIVRDRNGNPVIAGERFVGYSRSFSGVTERDVADIVKEFSESVPVTAIGTIIGR